jgi:short-chain Z-isoprenyl diphosphate synthase
MLAPIYRIYEHRLLRQVRAFPVPRHIGLILDGNRRFGRQNNVSDPHDIYMAGANKLDDLLDRCVELEIPAITLWVCSTANLKRPPEQVTSILAAVEKKLKLLVNDGQTHRRRIQVRAVGRRELLPPSTLAAVRAAEAATQDYRGVHLTIAAAYGGREEIVDAVRALLREQLAQNKSLNEIIGLVTPEAIGRSLYAPDLPDPDLIIRTSGEIRLSGFLLWRRAHLASSTSRMSIGRRSGG